MKKLFLILLAVMLLFVSALYTLAENEDNVSVTEEKPMGLEEEAAERIEEAVTPTPTPTPTPLPEETPVPVKAEKEVSTEIKTEQTVSIEVVTDERRIEEKASADADDKPETESVKGETAEVNTVDGLTTTAEIPVESKKTESDADETTETGNDVVVSGDVAHIQNEAVAESVSERSEDSVGKQSETTATVDKKPEEGNQKEAEADTPEVVQRKKTEKKTEKDADTKAVAERKETNEGAGVVSADYEESLFGELTAEPSEKQEQDEQIEPITDEADENVIRQEIEKDTAETVETIVIDNVIEEALSLEEEDGKGIIEGPDFYLGEVEGLSASKTSVTSILLTWNAMEGADEYVVLDTDLNEIGTTRGTSYSLKGLKPGSRFMIYVYGKRSGQSR